MTLCKDRPPVIYIKNTPHKLQYGSVLQELSEGHLPFSY